MAGTSEDPGLLRCPLCPSSGPPTANAPDVSLVEAGPSSLDPKLDASSSHEAQEPVSTAKGSSTDSPDLFWLECSRCKTWHHSVCLLLGDEKVLETVPHEIKQEIEDNHVDEEIWTDWTSWVDRWFCPKCIAWATDPDNERPPHHPLVATLDKKNFPPRSRIPLEGAQSDLKRSSSRATSPSSVKKPRLHSPLSDLSEATTHQGELDESKTINGDGRAQTVESDGKSQSRPKRQAAMHRPDYHALHHHIATPTGKWLDLIANPAAYGMVIREGNFPRLSAELVSKSWIDSSVASSSSSSSTVSANPSNFPPTLFYGPMREPLIIKAEDGGFEGLGGKLPGRSLTVADIGRLVGMDRMVDVIDVATQQSSQWPLSKWVDYIASRQHPPTDEAGPSMKTHNIISLEISGTELAKKVRPPRIVSEIDWVDNFWNFGPGGKSAAVSAAEGKSAKGEKPNGVNGVKAETPEIEVDSGPAKGNKGKAPASWPKVQLYCLMGAQGSWTDWHVDFAASSVYYTVHTGAKTFFFIRPTEQNLAAYAEWSGSYELQQSTWLGSMCDEVRKVTLRAGDTMIIPSGYIHAVYTPADSIVFGGNFLHSYDIETQLRLRQIEIDTKVPQRFRFPFFDRLCWYVADRYCSDLRLHRAYKARSNMNVPPLPAPRVLEGLYTLASFLVEQVTILDDPNAEEKRRKLIHDRIPSEVVRDPSGLARELLWRVQRELPHLVDNGHAERLMNGKKPGKNGLIKKPKDLIMLPAKPRSRVWNFSPTPWEQSDHPIQERSHVVEMTRPDLSDPSSVKSNEKVEEGPEEAEEVTRVYKQKRTRARDLEDGSTVMEEQDVVFTERRVIWAPPVPVPARVYGSLDVKPKMFTVPTLAKTEDGMIDMEAIGGQILASS